MGVSGDVQRIGSSVHTRTCGGVRVHDVEVALKRVVGVWAIAVAVVLSAVATSVAHPQDGPYRASYYEGAQGACGPLRGHYIASNYYRCGARLKLMYHGESTTGVVMDRMGAWPRKGCRCIDLAPALFRALDVPLRAGVFKVRVKHTHGGKA